MSYVHDDTSNWSEGIGNGTLFVPFIVFCLPLFCQLLAYMTSPDSSITADAGVVGLVQYALRRGAALCANGGRWGVAERVPGGTVG